MKIVLSPKTGRRVGSSKSGELIHARVNGSWRALCGTTPGKTGDWSSYPKTLELEEALQEIDKVTCKLCRKRLLNYPREEL